MLGALIGPIASLAGTFLQGQLEKTKANNEVKVATAKAKAIVIQRQATGEIEWDIEAIKGSTSSWKDEWLTILFSIPLILAFVPGMEEVVSNGFLQLDRMPDWYQYSLGVRSASKLFGKK